MSTATSADGTTIDYERYGDGPVTVFVAGAVQHRRIDPGTDAAARLLADSGFASVVYDRRGRGASGDTAPWRPEREVEDLAALLAGRPAVVYAGSSGATIALAAAGVLPEITGLILFEPPFFPGPAKTDQLAELQGLLDAGRPDLAMRFNFERVIGLPAVAVDGIAASPGWPAMCSVAPTLAYDFAALDDIGTDPDWTARWAGVGVPVLVCSGSESFPGLAHAADAVAAALPRARRRVVEGQAHNPAPEVIADLVREFHRSLG